MFVDGKYFEQKEPPKSPATPTGLTPVAAANISGGYAINVEIPGSPTAMTLNLTQNGNSLTGTLVSPMGTSPMTNGKVDGTSFSFKASVPYGGQNFDIDVSGKVAGQQVSGSIDSPAGTIGFSGTKNP